jgi:hypothetical protein
MPRRKRPIPEEIQNVRTQLTEWRKSNPHRSRLPEELWTAAVELARHHGLYRTARALPIDYVGLRKRLQLARPAIPAVERQPEFVEVRLEAAPCSSSHIELMRVPMNGAVDWAQLLRAWRQGER